MEGVRRLEPREVDLQHGGQPADRVQRLGPAGQHGLARVVLHRDTGQRVADQVDEALRPGGVGADGGHVGVTQTGLAQRDAPVADDLGALGGRERPRGDQRGDLAEAVADQNVRAQTAGPQHGVGRGGHRVDGQLERLRGLPEQLLGVRRPRREQLVHRAVAEQRTGGVTDLGEDRSDLGELVPQVGEGTAVERTLARKEDGNRSFRHDAHFPHTHLRDQLHRRIAPHFLDR